MESTKQIHIHLNATLKPSLFTDASEQTNVTLLQRIGVNLANANSSEDILKYIKCKQKKQNKTWTLYK